VASSLIFAKSATKCTEEKCGSTNLGVYMQTFLPYANFDDSAKCLDRQRLGKQRVETLQIMRTLAGLSSGWRTHPAVKMWDGYEAALTLYGVAVCTEWRRRGYKDTCEKKITEIYYDFFRQQSMFDMPPWLGGQIHVTHQSKLIQKFPAHYEPIFGNVPVLEYYWPTSR
jgi:hypothetical protein